MVDGTVTFVSVFMACIVGFSVQRKFYILTTSIRIKLNIYIVGNLTPDLVPSIALVALGFTLSYTSWAYVCTYMFAKVETLQSTWKYFSRIHKTNGDTEWLGLINTAMLLPAGFAFLPAPYDMLSNLTPPSAVATAFLHLAELKDRARVVNQQNYLAFLDPNLEIYWSLVFFLGQSVLFFAILVIVDSLVSPTPFFHTWN